MAGLHARPLPTRGVEASCQQWLTGNWRGLFFGLSCTLFHCQTCAPAATSTWESAARAPLSPFCHPPLQTLPLKVVQEAAIASAVAHPHVVSVFSVGLRPCRPPQQQQAQQAQPQPGRPPQIGPSSADAGGAGGGNEPVLWQLTSGPLGLGGEGVSWVPARLLLHLDTASASIEILQGLAEGCTTCPSLL